MLGLLARCEIATRRLLSELISYCLFRRRFSLCRVDLVGYGAHAGLIPEMQVDLDKFGSNHSLGATADHHQFLSAAAGVAPYDQ